MRKILDAIHVPNWVVGILALVLILRIPSFFEPYYYGDEMVYLTLGEGIRQGITLYSGLHDNKPPLIYILGAIAGSLTLFKIILAFWNLATIILFYKLSKALFPEKTRLQKIATLIFGILTTIPLFEGNTVNSELFMIGSTIAAFLILLTQKLNLKTLLLSGILFSISALFKIPAVFDVPVIVVYWLVKSEGKKEEIIQTIKRTFVLGIGFAVPILATFVWYFANGALKEYFTGVFLQNIGYLSSFRSGDIQKPFLERNLPLLIRAFILFLGSVLLYLKRRSLSKEFIFLTLWLLFTLFAVTLSERPYPHYLVQSLPAISFLLGMLAANETVEQSLVIIPLALAFLVPVLYKFYYYPVGPYYQRFLEFASGKINKTQYLSRFGQNVQRDYDISEFITTSLPKGERVFVWEDSTAIYALSRHLPPIKYVAGYHIRDFSSKEDIAVKLENEKPKFIVLLPKSSYPELIPLLRKSYILINTIDGAEIWSHFR